MWNIVLWGLIYYTYAGLITLCGELISYYNLRGKQLLLFYIKSLGVGFALSDQLLDELPQFFLDLVSVMIPNCVQTLQFCRKTRCSLSPLWSRCGLVSRPSSPGLGDCPGIGRPPASKLPCQSQGPPLPAGLCNSQVSGDSESVSVSPQMTCTNSSGIGRLT